MNLSLLDLPQTSLEQKVLVSQVLDEQLIKAATYILERLDLSVREASEELTEESSSNPTDCLQLYNLAQLLELILPAMNPRERFKNYVSYYNLNDYIKFLSNNFFLVFSCSLWVLKPLYDQTKIHSFHPCIK